VDGDLTAARKRAYEGVALVAFDGAQFRRDIASAATRP
jgi:phosphoribosylamine-glycine ligase